MKAIMTFLIFLLCGVVALALLGTAVVYVTVNGQIPDTAAGHYIMAGVYLMMFCSIFLSGAGMLAGAALGLIGFILGSRIRTIFSFALGIFSGMLWYYLLNCRM